MKLISFLKEWNWFLEYRKNEKSLSESQLNHEMVDRFVVVVVKVVLMCKHWRKVVRRFEDGHVEEMELEWWFEQDIDVEERRLKKMKMVVKYKNLVI
ncbi:hypothetical protein Tco_1563070 [Tanacetum coccineum]